MVTALEHERVSARQVERNMTARPARSTHAWAQLSQPRFGSTVRDGGAAPELVYCCQENTRNPRERVVKGPRPIWLSRERDRGTCTCCWPDRRATLLKELTRAADTASVRIQDLVALLAFEFF